ncbi:hypothetical protein H4R20_001030 [Coemansia guatemalensis]|uniref:Ankyrin n=1 Tax=Coemansia guatemalensis TaxID=2761395 RepID=A0A9W8HZY7_9FUNG|nr:hypothetical protein H4R20_001030 [Coemansia guatemalensis]
MVAFDDEGATRDEQLRSACMSDQPTMVKQLLEGQQPANVNCTNALGFTPLHYAAQTGAVECVKLLAKAPGINLNIQDRMSRNTPLHMALIHRSKPQITLETVTLLTRAGADPRIVNKIGQRPRDLTDELDPNDQEIRRLLLQAAVTIGVLESKAHYAGLPTSGHDDKDDGSASDSSG